VIHTLDLFEPLEDRLLEVLRSLSRDDWARPTIAGAWTVRDVAAHLLDTPLRRLSFVRDGWPPTGVEIRTDADLVAFVNALNADGVRTYGRLSPPVLIDLLSLAMRQAVAHLRGIAPDAPAAFPVSWAGQTASAHWFDVAREYTERWHHQAQIRLAVDRLAPLLSESLYAPVIATFMHAVPHALRHVPAPRGAQVAVIVDGTGGGIWHVRRDDGGWRLGGDLGGEPAARIVIPAAMAWRLLTKGLAPESAARHCEVTGDPRLGAAVLAARAIVG
jgi:uncharacterized protein (TIGR03083 family)